jgi:SAM-dependent methyltransferase
MERCPICGGSTALRFTMRDVPIRRCASCGHGFADYRADERHLATIYGDDYFSATGPGYADYLSEAELLQRQGLRYGALISRYAPRGRVLDVGSAAGFIAAGMRDGGLAVTGLEPNERMASYASDSLRLPTRNEALETLDVVGAYDVVSMIQVVAHFFDPRRAFAAAARATRSGGYWLIEGWKADSAVARMLGWKWHVYNPPSVLNYFTMKSLDLLAAEFGFVRIATGRPRKLVTAAHAATLFEFLAPRSKALRVAAKVADRMPRSFVLPYPGDDIFWAVYEGGALASRARLAGRPSTASKKTIRLTAGSGYSNWLPRSPGRASTPAASARKSEIIYA